MASDEEKFIAMMQRHLERIDAPSPPQPQPQPPNALQRARARNDRTAELAGEATRGAEACPPAAAAIGRSGALTADQWLALPLPRGESGDAAHGARAKQDEVEIGARSLSAIDDELDRAYAKKHGKGRRRLSSVGTAVRALAVKRSVDIGESDKKESEKRRCVRCRKLFTPASNSVDACAYHPGSQQYWWGGWAGSSRTSVAEAAGLDTLNAVGKACSLQYH